MTCPSAAKKSRGSHPFGVGLGEDDNIALVQELKPGSNFSHLFPRRNFLVLRPVPLKNAYFNSANPEVSNGLPLVELR